MSAIDTPTRPADRPVGTGPESASGRRSRPGLVARIEEATPADRDRVVDLVRGAAMLVVAVGHWLLAVVTLGPDRDLHGANALAEVPVLQRATWLLQVMPLFFLAGGVANAASWRSAQAAGTRWATWMQGRLERLVRPTAVFAIAWTVLALVLRLTEAVGPGALRMGAQLVAVPLWFLAVYVVIVAITPVGLALHRRHGLRVPVSLTVAAAAVDAAHRAGVPVIGWTSFLLVWMVPQQLGFAWADGTLLRRRSTGPLLASSGLVALVLLTTVGPYPVSMVGVPGAATSNNAPPTPALIALSVWQLGLLLTARPLLARWLARPRVWAAVVLTTARAMTVYLWHLTALVVVAVALIPSGRFPVPAAGTASWWATRPLWIAVLTVALVPIVALASRFEHPAPATAGTVTAPRMLVAVTSLCATFALLATYGFSVAASPAGLPVAALGVGTVAAVTVRGRR